MNALSAVVLNMAWAATVALAPPGAIPDDRIPWGPEGTIGRGTDTPPGRNWRWDRASGSWIPYGPAAQQGAAVRSTPAAPRASGPYITNQFYEPGDGYRYPLYYDPASRNYFYYPVRR